MENDEELQHPKCVENIQRILSSLGISCPRVYGIKTAALKDFQEHPDWQEFWTWAKAEVEKKVAGKDLYSKEKYHQELDKLGYGGYYSDKRLNKTHIHNLAKHCNEKTSLFQFSKMVKEAEELAKGYEALKDMRAACNYFNIKIPEVNTQSFNLKHREDFLYKVYPLLSQLTSGDVSKCYDHVGLYVNAVDGN
jgi:hypothetical protein